MTLVMLPGAGMSARDFLTQGFVSVIRERGLPVDVLAVGADVADYLHPDFCQRLNHEIAALQKPGRSTRVSLMGISLGAQAALRFLRENLMGIEGVMLIAPFLATRGAVAEVVRAGGLDGWHHGMPGCEAEDERELFSWLKDRLHPEGALPRICVGYATEDRYADSGRLLAARLPSACVFRTAGGHDWVAWRTLWFGMLDQWHELSGGCTQYD